MKWATRNDRKVDRIARPRLIKQFVDPDAEFLYVPKDDVLPIAEREGATPFDIPDAELGHHGDECSFDAIVHKYGLADKDSALARLALIVRGANTPAARPDGPSHAAWLRSLRASAKRVPTTTSSSRGAARVRRALCLVPPPGEWRRMTLTLSGHVPCPIMRSTSEMSVGDARRLRLLRRV
jgi:hypothetical protein